MKIRLSLWTLFVAMAITALGCAGPKTHNLPPAQRLLEPGPGVGGPGPGVMMPPGPTLPLTTGQPVAPLPTIQVLFPRPESMQVQWDVGGVGQFDSTPLVVPGRQNFTHAAIYRLKLTNIPGREGIELYPTLEIAPMSFRTEAFLAHNALPVQFTEEDFDQALTGNFVTKVIYLPAPEFQELALAGVETLVSTRLDPGIDPIVEADRRGSILAVIRLGNKDVELAGGMEGMGGIIPSTFDIAHRGHCPITMGPHGPMAMGPHGPAPTGPSGLVPQHVAGLTAPQWGMPMSGTPIGLPGPPHIPLGHPAGLQKHVMKNHTPMKLPGPSKDMKIHVRQQPGFSYPKPANRAYVKEQYIHPSLPFGQPKEMKHQVVH